MTEPGLSRRERQIMDIIYAQGEATAIQVLENLEDPPSKTAVRTLLRILEEKGHLKHTERGREYALSTPPTAHPRRPLRVSARPEHLFRRPLEKAVAAHLADSAADLSADELKRLANLIQQARKKG